MKISFIFCADTESSLEKIHIYDHDLTKMLPSEIYKQTACGYSLFINCSFDSSKNKPDFYRIEGSMKMFCRDLKEHTAEVINCEKKEMLPLIKKRKNHTTNKNSAIYAIRNSVMNLPIMKIIVKFEITLPFTVSLQRKIQRRYTQSL